MVISEINKVFDSFNLFLDHEILQKGQAYRNISSLFYQLDDDYFSNYSVYSAPFKQFVYDTSISGANIISGINTPLFIEDKTSGINIDYWNGRVISSGAINIPISGNYSIKEFNLYPTEKSDEELLFETKYETNTYYPPTGGLRADKVVAPCVFTNVTNMYNDAAEFGGADWTTIQIHALILADSKYKLDSIGNILIDTKYNNFCLVDGTPFNEFGGLKYPFNYLNFITNSYDMACIDDVDFYKLNDKEFTKRYNRIYVGFADFQIKLFRIT